MKSENLSVEARSLGHLQNQVPDDEFKNNLKPTYPIVHIEQRQDEAQHAIRRGNQWRAGTVVMKVQGPSIGADETARLSCFSPCPDVELLT